MVFIRCILFFSLLVLALSGCRKELPELNAEKIDLPVNGQVRCILDADSLWLIGGGDKEGMGFLLKTTDFASFETISKTFDNPVYSMAFFQDRFVFGFPDAEIQYSNDLIEFYPHYPEEEYWINTPLKQPLYDMLVVEDRLIITGGEEIRYGLILTSVEEEEHSQFQPCEYENALRSVAVSGNGEIWAVGNGIVLKSTDLGNSWENEAFDSEYMTSIRFDESGNGLISTFGGAVFSTSNNGEDWEQEDLDANFSTRYLRKIATNENGDWVSVGNNGLVITQTEGSWKSHRISSEDDLQDVVFMNSDEVLIGGQGSIYRFRL